jgi:hypothetical protein
MSSAVRETEAAPAYPAVGTILLTILTGVGVSVAWLLHSASNYQERFNVLFASSGGLNPLYQGSPDNPMPLYYLGLHALAHLAEPTLVTLRVVSIACYVLAVPAIYWAARIATDDRRAGTLSAILLGLSPFMIWYSNRAAVYAPLVLVTILNQLSFSLLLRKRQWAWPFYGLTALLGLGLHYFFFVILILQWVFFAIKRNAYTLRDQLIMLGFAVATTITFVLWMRYLVDTIHVFDILPYAGKPAATNAFIIYVQYLFGFQSVTTTTLIIAFWPLLVILGLLAVQKYVRPTRSLQYYAFCSFMVIIGVFALSWAWKSLFLSSYLIIGLPSFLLLLSWYFCAFDLNILAWARVALVAVMIAMLVLQLNHRDFAVRQDYLGSAVRAQSVSFLTAPNHRTFFNKLNRQAPLP